MTASQVIDSNRSGSIDMAKGITIFLVIAGHAAGNLDTPLYRILLYYFHMPLFFIISGMMMIRGSDDFSPGYWKRLLVKNFQTLMIPYFLWALIYSQFSYKNVLWILYGSWEALGKVGTLTSLWFLPCLFFARIIMGAIKYLTRNWKMDKYLLMGLLAIPAFFLGLLFPKVEIGYFWCFNISFMALAFLLLGAATQRVVKKYYTALGQFWYWLGLAVSIAVFLMGTVLRKEPLELVLMCCSDYGNLLYFLINAISGSAAIFFLSMILSDIAKRFQPLGFLRTGFSYIGSITMGIFIMHKPFLQEVVMKFFALFGYSTNSALAAFLGAVPALAFSCLAVWLIQRYIPQLLGVFPKAGKSG